jgi:transposase-like protein
MGRAAKEQEQERRARARLRVIRHYEQVTRNVSRTCRFFGISRTIFYRWGTRYQRTGASARCVPRLPQVKPGTRPSTSRLCQRSACDGPPRTHRSHA